MNAISKIAFHRNIRNEEPNKALAKELAEADDFEGIKEISTYLYDKNKSIASDCLAVLYTIGYSKPEHITDYLGDFLKLLKSKNNRMVWGSMIAIATIAPLKSDEIFREVDKLLEVMKTGTVITEVWGIKALVGLSLANEAFKNRLLPVLYDYLDICRPIDFATRVETMLPVMVSAEEINQLKQIILLKQDALSPAQQKKLKSVLKGL